MMVTMCERRLHMPSLLSMPHSLILLLLSLLLSPLLPCLLLLSLESRLLRLRLRVGVPVDLEVLRATTSATVGRNNSYCQL